MLESSFLHFKGIGKKNSRILKEKKLYTWYDILDFSDSLPFSSDKNRDLILQAELNIQKREQKDWLYFSEKLHPSEKWKLLKENLSIATYFDIETNGYSYGDNITLIICYSKNRVYQFVNGDNLESFLDFLEDVSLLVSFNGTSFDIPMIQNYFRLPNLEIPHIDLRWLSYHTGLKGGLKQIEKQIQIHRTDAIQGLNGMDAILLWNEWKHYKNYKAYETLIEYCTADVLSLEVLAKKIIERNENSLGE